VTLVHIYGDIGIDELLVGQFAEGEIVALLEVCGPQAARLAHLDLQLAREHGGRIDSVLRKTTPAAVALDPNPVPYAVPDPNPAAPRSFVRCPCVSVWGAAVDHSAVLSVVSGILSFKLVGV